MRGIYIDTETGGLSSKSDALVSVAAVAFEIDARNPVEWKSLDTYYQPVKPIPHADTQGLFLNYSPEAYAVHGLSVDWLKKHGEEEHLVYMGLIRFCQTYLNPNEQFAGRIWAHNAPFDHGFVKQLENRVWVKYDFPTFDSIDLKEQVIHPRCDWSCTKNMWCMMRGMGIHNKGGSLSDIIDHYGIFDPRAGNKHNALTDANLSIEVLTHMLFDIRRYYHPS